MHWHRYIYNNSCFNLLQPKTRITSNNNPGFYYHLLFLRYLFLYTLRFDLNLSNIIRHFITAKSIGLVRCRSRRGHSHCFDYWNPHRGHLEYHIRHKYNLFHGDNS